MTKQTARVTFLFAAVALGGWSRDVRAQQSAPGYVHPEALVSADWLAAHLTDANLRVVDLRPNGFAESHIPGSLHLDNAAIRDVTNQPTFVPTPAAFSALMSQLGISNRTRVIAYDERGGIYAARLWWILNYYGHANVALLDGGWVKWTKDSRATSATTAPVAPASFTATPNPRWIATAADVLEATKRSATKIVDARTVAEIEGRDLRGIKRGGAVPNSIPVYWEDALDPATKTFKSAAELRKLYLDHGIQPQDDVIAYCQVGMRASHDLFGMYLVGYANLRNYYGAWEEWGNREDLPIKK